MKKILLVAVAALSIGGVAHAETKFNLVCDTRLEFFSSQMPPPQDFHEIIIVDTDAKLAMYESMGKVFSIEVTPAEIIFPETKANDPSVIKRETISRIDGSVIRLTRDASIKGKCVSAPFTGLPKAAF